MSTKYESIKINSRSINKNDSIAWKYDKCILWALCWAPRNDFGCNFRHYLINKIFDRDGKKNFELYGSQQILNALKDHEIWYTNFTIEQKYHIINYDIIGRDEDDPIRKLMNQIGVDKTESDKNKKKLCIHFRNDECDRGAACSFSHHPSFLWNDMIINTKPLIKYGYNVNCELSKYEKILNLISFDKIGIMFDDPIYMMCRQLNVTNEDIYKKENFKTILCKYFRNSICTRGNDCTYSHHPSMLWSFAPGEWSSHWTYGYFVFWTLCFAPRDNTGIKFRRIVIDKILSNNNGNCIDG